MPWIDAEQARRVGRALAPAVRGYVERGVDRFVDERYYPPGDADRGLVASYFLVMVAMDHRLSRPGRPYEARLPGEGLYHGADLLYRLGRRMLDNDPGFFAAERLAGISVEEVRAWLCVGDVCPPDPERRAWLLRDLGRKLLQLYRGDPLRLVEESGGLLHTWDPGSPGFVERLRVFEAYNDPVEKKPMLLAKFLERRGLLRVGDPWHKRVPVDNHVTRIALRTGIVEPEPGLRVKLLRQLEARWWEDVALRIQVREAWHIAALEAGVDDFILDDLLWTMGRRVCVHGRPLCRGCSGHPACTPRGSCVLVDVCPTGMGARRPVEEHLFLDTHWY